MASSTKITLDQQQRQQLAPLRFHKVFFALIPPHHILKELQALQVYFQQDFKGRYIEYANLHSTLVYIGTVEESMILSLKNALASITITPFDAQIISISMAHNTHAKMLWADLAKEPITSIIESIENVILNQTHIKYEKKYEIKPHITLARLSKEMNNKIIESMPLNLSWHVDTIYALESVQNAFGQVSYKTLFTIKLS